MNWLPLVNEHEPFINYGSQSGWEDRMKKHNLTFEEYDILSKSTDAGLTLDHRYGLIGEVGELFEIWKRVERGDYLADSHSTVRDELGDILWYLAALARDYGYTLQEIAEYNIQKLRQRYPNGWTVEDSLNRKEYQNGKEG